MSFPLPDGLQFLKHPNQPFPTGPHWVILATRCFGYGAQVGVVHCGYDYFPIGVLQEITGFFFDWIEITLIVLPLFAPIMKLMDFGVHIPYPVDIVPWIAILLAVNLQTSFLTPPFGFALFYMKGVAPPHVKMQQIYRGIIPFVTLQLIGLGFVIGFPQLALWLPHVLLD